MNVLLISFYRIQKQGFRLLIICFCLSLAACGPPKKTASKRPAPKSRTTASRKAPAKKQPQKTSKGNASSSLKKKYATQLGVSANQIANVKLYGFVDTWMGVKYKYGGMSRSGVDCSGFSNLLYKEVYKKQLKRTTRDIAQTCKPVSKNNLREGDLVFFDISGKKNTHMGVYLQNGKFVHASSSRGVVISDLSNPYYKKYYARGGRLK